MNRPARTIVCGNPATIPPPLELLDEVEHLMTFAKSAECVNRPAAVPRSPTNGVAGNSICLRSIK